MHTFAIMGAGGLGAFYGGLLARAGHTVHFIARGAHLEAMQRQGLRVESDTAGDFTLDVVQATDDPGTVGPVDVVLMGVKAYDLTAAGEAIRPMMQAQTMVVPLLNGVDMAERIGAVIGMEHLLGGVVYASSNIMAPGHVRHVLNAPLVFGELDGGLSDRVTALEATLRDAGLVVQASAEIRAELWRKYLFVSALAAVCGVVRLPTRAVLSYPATRELMAACMAEVAALAAASGVPLEPDIVAQTLAKADRFDPRHTVSLLLDLRRGRRLELDAMVGTVVRLGREHGVPTPVSAVLHAALVPYAQGPPPDATAG